MILLLSHSHLFYYFVKLYILKVCDLSELYYEKVSSLFKSKSNNVNQNRNNNHNYVNDYYNRKELYRDKEVEIENKGFNNKKIM